jgi:transcriptional regulator with XRE-family HTH domain
MPREPKTMSEAFMNTFSMRLTQYLKKKGLNQEKFAKTLNMNRNSISAWCKNKSQITTKSLVLIKEKFPDLQFEDIPNIRKKYQQDTFIQNVADSAEVIYNIKNLPPGLENYKILITIDFEKITPHPHSTPK